MKKLQFNRRRLLRAIHAACVALFFAACAQQAEAQNYNHADFSVSGSNVTAIASDGTGAYFVGAAPNAYAFTIGSAYTLGNTTTAGGTNNLISFDNGSVNNAGTLTASNYTIVINSTTATSTVTNSGSITSSGINPVCIFGNGVVNNSSSGTIAYTGPGGPSYSSLYIKGNATVNNAGFINGTHNYDGVKIQNGSGTVTNSGTISGANDAGVDFDHNYGTVNNSSTGSISGYYFGVYIRGGSGGASSVTNSDSITSSNSAYYSEGIHIGSTGSSYGASGVTVTNSGTGTISGYANNTSGTGSASAYGVLAQSYDGNISITNKAGGSISGFAKSSMSSAYGYGIYALSSHNGNITISNSGYAGGKATTSALDYRSGSGYGISASSYNGNVTVTNNAGGTVKGTGTGSDAYGKGFGIMAAASNNGNVTITNSGYAMGQGDGNSTSGYPNPNISGTGYGIFATSVNGAITITNSGSKSAYGSGSSYYSGVGFGIWAKSTGSGTINIINNGTASGYGSGFVTSGSGSGIYARTNGGNLTITNNGTATGSDGTYTVFGAGTGSGIYSTIKGGSGNITITNAGTATGTGSSYLGATHAYGTYSSSYGSGNITITNSGTSKGNSTSGTYSGGYNSDNASGTGILVRDEVGGGGAIFIKNSGTASGTGSVYGSGSAYGYGINVHTNGGSAALTINNSGRVTGSAYSSTGSASGYGIWINAGSGAVTITNTISGYIGGGRFSGSGTSSGIYLTGGAPPVCPIITNMGTISGSTSSYYHGVGIYAKYYTGPIMVNEIGGEVRTGTSSSYYSGGPDAIYLGSGDNIVNIVGQANNTGLIEGGSSGDNTLTLHLAGMTPAQKLALQAAVLANSGSGYYQAGGVTYSWHDFQHISGTFVSLEQVVDPGLLDVARKIDNLTSYPGVAYGPFYVAAASNPEAATNSLVGREFDDALGTIGKNEATALSEVWDSRAFALRSGTGGFDLSGLNVMPGSMIASLGETQNTLGRLMGASALGGTTMSDEPIEPVRWAPAETNRWGAWASGTVTLADESSTASAPGYNYRTGSPTIGADYRVSNDFAIGALLNYSTTGAHFSDGSRLGVETGLGALYGTWSDGPWYINGLAGGGVSDYDNRRTTLGGQPALSHPDGDEVLANLTGGYDFKLGGGWKISPEAGFLYTHITENSYTEGGAGAYDLSLPDQNIDSLRSKLGFQVLDNFTWNGIAFTPQFHGAWYHEILDDSRGVSTSLPGAPALGSFVVQTNAEGRDFAILGAGLSATPAQLSGDVTFFVNYDAQVGQTDFISHTVNGGVRVNF